MARRTAHATTGAYTCRSSTHFPANWGWMMLRGCTCTWAKPELEWRAVVRCKIGWIWLYHLAVKTLSLQASHRSQLKCFSIMTPAVPAVQAIHALNELTPSAAVVVVAGIFGVCFISYHVLRNL